MTATRHVNENSRKEYKNQEPLCANNVGNDRIKELRIKNEDKKVQKLKEMGLTGTVHRNKRSSLSSLTFFQHKSKIEAGDCD